MRSKIGIVYETATGKIRRIIVPDEDYQLAAHAAINYDETFLTEDYTGPADIASIAAIIQRHTGKTPT